MEIFFYIVIFIYWLLFWSFASVIIHRLKSWEKWILWWRSHCNKCNTKLKYYDLIPVLSWLSTLWKCRYCDNNISKVYPFLEIFNWILFLLISVFLVDINNLLLLDSYEIIKLIFWLIIWFITTIYIFYDILFLEIHEGIMLTWITTAFLGLLINDWIINILPTINNINLDLNLAYSIGIIPISLIIIWLLYAIMLKELEIKYDFAILVTAIITIITFLNISWLSIQDSSVLSWIVWAIWIFIFFFLQIVLSWWKALWWWDLRIWIMIWLLLGASFSIAWLMITYIVGSIISIALIIYKYIKTKKSKINTQVPFWPFLGIWFFITIFYLDKITKFIEIHF